MAGVVFRVFDLPAKKDGYVGSREEEEETVDMQCHPQSRRQPRRRKASARDVDPGDGARRAADEGRPHGHGQRVNDPDERAVGREAGERVAHRNRDDGRQEREGGNQGESQLRPAFFLAKVGQ